MQGTRVKGRQLSGAVLSSPPPWVGVRVPRFRGSIPLPPPRGRNGPTPCARGELRCDLCLSPVSSRYATWPSA